jgi:hypothetical protein
MKTVKVFRFLPGLLLLASLSTLTFFSCKKEAAQQDTTSLSGSHENVPVSQRACTSVDFCEFSVRTSINATLTVCGGLESGTLCACGCDPGNDIGIPNQAFLAGTSISFCVSKGRKVCLCNSGTSVDIPVFIDFGGGNTITTTVFAGQKVCIEVNSSCVPTVITPC